jgi:hypothetical protein
MLVPGLRPRAMCSYKARGDLSEYFSSVLTNTQVFYFFYKIHVDREPLRSFARVVGNYKACTIANQLARNLSVIL